MEARMGDIVVLESRRRRRSRSERMIEALNRWLAAAMAADGPAMLRAGRDYYAAMLDDAGGEGDRA
jgi:hypothetical protein